eukprot:SAG11_NODE_22910_length_398_cov_0.859532_1_plen_75_part_10
MQCGAMSVHGQSSMLNVALHLKAARYIILVLIIVAATGRSLEAVVTTSAPKTPILQLLSSPNLLCATRWPITLVV